MLYEYRHSGRRRRGCPETFELRRKVSERDDPAPCPRCGSSVSERIKFQAFGIGAGSDGAAGAGPPKPPGSGPYDDHIPANMPDDLDSDIVPRR